MQYDNPRIPENSVNISVENQMSTTVVFPDATLPEPTNGGFENQEEFLAFVTAKQNGKWNSALHSRPLAERLADYNGDTIAQAFPLLFPYGHSGLAEDKAVIEMRDKLPNHKRQMQRARLNVLRKYLQHRKPDFHSPMFNLIVENMIMKESIFTTTKMYCNVKRSDQKAMGQKYGEMTSANLSKAIQAVRCNSGVQYSGKPENEFLKSIRASCQELPHSNESSQQARKIYFSFCIQFGLPCIFLTITPDDLRNFRIVVYAMKGEEYQFGKTEVNGLSDTEILADFKIRQEIRSDYPGLCAEEYGRIVDLVIKHLFSWDETKQESTGVGLFGELLAWCLATEEQGRKSLHGHILLFIKDWNKVLNILHRRNAVKEETGLSFTDAKRKATRFYKNAASANLFSDFVAPTGLMHERPVFFHDKCAGQRNPSGMRFSVEPVPDQSLREMRHKRLCHEHNGCIANCLRCERKFTVQDIVESALNHHLGTTGGSQIGFPDFSKRLDRHVYEMQKNYKWLGDSDYSNARRYFASNALVNIHFVTHANRCFKKGSECYTNLPDAVMENVMIVYNDCPDIWSDYLGVKQNKSMFRFYPFRPIEDVFMNTHNPTITSLLGCNNNVMVGMNGCSVFYVTGYNVKSQQKEERHAFEQVSKVIVKLLRKQVRH